MSRIRLPHNEADETKRYSVMSSEVKRLIDQLPQPDVIEECAKAGFEATNSGQRWADIGGERFKELRRIEAASTIRRFCELEGIPVPKYLEER